MTVPHYVKQLEKRLEQRYEKDTDDKEYTDTDPEGWFICNYCGRKIYYSRRQPRKLVKHETECEGSSGVPDPNEEKRQS